jgi:signal transduction histidine kinase
MAEGAARSARGRVVRVHHRGATELQDVADACARIALDVAGAHAAGVYLREEGAIAPRLRARAGEATLPDELGPTDAESRVVGLTAGGREIGALVLQGAVRAQPMFLSTFAGATAVAIQNAQRLSLEREAVERLSELSRMKSTLLATVSHELRTPLTTVIGFADLLGRQFDTASPEEQREMIDLIIEQGHQLRALIEDLVDASRVEFGTLRVDCTDVDARAVIERAARGVPAASHPLEISVPDGLGPVRADERRLQQVITNLVGNAMEHSPPGSPVVVDVRPDGHGVAFAVTDRGKGIDPQFLPHIFEPFAQAERGGRGTGLGLGLYIVRGLVEAMGGRIEADSRVGEGSEFRVWLPLAG